MKYSFICIIALGVSLTASAGFLDKISKAASKLNETIEDTAKALQQTNSLDSADAKCKDIARVKAEEAKQRVIAEKERQELAGKEAVRCEKEVKTLVTGDDSPTKIRAQSLKRNTDLAQKKRLTAIKEEENAARIRAQSLKWETDLAEKKRLSALNREEEEAAFIDSMYTDIEIGGHNNMVSKEEFSLKNDLTDNEYKEWKQAVINAIGDKNKKYDVINTSRERIVDLKRKHCRLHLPTNEVVIYVDYSDVYTDQAQYRIKSNGQECSGSTYEYLALNYRLGLSKGSPIPRKKLDEILDKKEEAKVAVQKRQAEKRLVEQKAEEDPLIASLRAWDISKAKKKAKKLKSKTPVVKSLYLGMPIDDALGLLFNMLDGSDYYIYPKVIRYGDVSEVMRKKGFLETTLGSISITDFVSNNMEYDTKSSPVVVIFSGDIISGYVFADASGRAIKIMLEGYLVDLLFNAKNMEAEYFVEKFAPAYGIPDMELMIDDDWNRSWVFTAKNGVRVEVDSSKALTLERVASRKDIDAAFD